MTRQDISADMIYLGDMTITPVHGCLTSVIRRELVKPCHWQWSLYYTVLFTSYIPRVDQDMSRVTQLGL